MKIFKKSEDGDIRYLDIQAFSDGRLTQTSGIVGTVNPVTHEKVCKAKNAGKKNESTPGVQALKEMESLITKKIREGYFEKMADAINKEVILPMLAKDYKKEFKKIDWNHTFVQIKYDGMRCLAHIKDGKVKLISRENVEIKTMGHIVEELSKIKEDIILDGELFVEANFQENMKAIKSYKEGISEKISYYIYDIVSQDIFSKRSKHIKELIQPLNTKHLKIVSTYKINSELELKDYHKKFIEEGFEGTIIRLDEPYRINIRSSSLLKYKDFQDIALEIIDIVPCEQRPTWGKPQFELNGKKFEAGMKYTHAQREDFLANKKQYIGKIGEVRFFEYSENGIPRFAIMHGMRLDKTKSDKVKTKKEKV